MPTFTALLAILSALAASQRPTAAAERTAIEEAIAHYFRAGDTASAAELRRAFHPAAMMFSVDKEGALAGVSQPEWWARLDANKSPMRALGRRFELVDVEGNAAVAKVVSDYTAFRFEDYMSLLKIGGTWKIVGKIFHRTDTSPDVKAAPARDAPAGSAGIETALRALFRAQDASDAAVLAGICDPRQVTYTLLEGQLVGTSLAEWQARLTARRKAGRPEAAMSHRFLLVDAESNAAVAKVAHEGEEARLVDYVSLLELGGSWRIVGIVTVREARNPAATS
ncbi:MAG TPA: nuclear transport factor 2 family protein [Thermoanaerobaculia bacterium]|nr:nuclear transport factor 2 family protein [Thermoanaerobaculia bacterium]